MRGLLIPFLLAASSALSAQGSDRTASRELLDRARVALNDLRFMRADSIAREVLSLALISRNARVEALQIVAAANYSESPAERRESPARSAISQLLQIDLGNTIPPELATPALDSLYRSVWSTTFATSVFVRRENPINGMEGTALIRVKANRPASFTVKMRTKDGIESFLLDSVTVATDTTLALRVARDGQLLLKGGDYDLVIAASELTSRQTVAKTFDAVAIVPGVEFLVIPADIDSSLLKPERSLPERSNGIIAGVLLGAATIAIGKGLRAPDPVRAGGETDRRYMAVGALMTIGSIAAAWFDRGRVLDKGVASNRRALTDLATRQHAAREENLKRAAGYRASITVNPESR